MCGVQTGSNRFKLDILISGIFFRNQRVQSKKSTPLRNIVIKLSSKLILINLQKK